MKARTILGALCIVAMTTFMAAQTTLLHADIPFQFYVGEKVMPAGHYTVVEVNQSALILRLEDTNISRAFVTYPAQRDEKSAKPVMTFRRIGDVHFLRQIWKDYGTSGRELPISKIQVQVAQQGLPPSEVVIAMGRK